MRNAKEWFLSLKPEYLTWLCGHRNQDADTRASLAPPLDSLILMPPKVEIGCSGERAFRGVSIGYCQIRGCF